MQGIIPVTTEITSPTSSILVSGLATLAVQASAQSECVMSRAPLFASFSSWPVGRKSMEFGCQMGARLYVAERNAGISDEEALFWVGGYTGLC